MAETMTDMTAKLNVYGLWVLLSMPAIWLLWLAILVNQNNRITQCCAFLKQITVERRQRRKRCFDRRLRSAQPVHTRY